MRFERIEMQLRIMSKNSLPIGRRKREIGECFLPIPGKWQDRKYQIGIKYPLTNDRIERQLYTYEKSSKLFRDSDKLMNLSKSIRFHVNFDERIMIKRYRAHFGSD